METLRHKTIKLIAQCLTVYQKSVQNSNLHGLASNVVSFPWSADGGKKSVLDFFRLIELLTNNSKIAP